MRPVPLLAALVLAMSHLGCTPTASPPAAAPSPSVATVVDSGPTKVELGNARAEWREPEAEVVKFEIPYRFVSGSPVKVYQCRVTFPEDGVAGLKPMEAWELKQDGVIRTGIPANGTLVRDYRIQFWEAESPDKEYFLVSNTVTGTVPPPPQTEAHQQPRGH